MHHVELGHHLEQLARHMHRGSVAGRRQGDLARVRIGIGDEIGHRLHRQIRRHHHNIGELHRGGDRRGVAHVIERQVLVQRLADGVVRRHEHDGVAVGRRVDHGLGRDHAALAGLVLDHAGLAQVRLQPVAEDAGDDVVWPAGQKADDELDRTDRILVGGDGAAQRDADQAEQQNGKTNSVHEFLPDVRAS
jgi:hypothetical protein